MELSFPFIMLLYALDVDRTTPCELNIFQCSYQQLYRTLDKPALPLCNALIISTDSMTNSNECVLDVDAIFNKYNFQDGLITFAAFTFICLSDNLSISLDFSNCPNALENVIGHVEVYACKFHMEQMDTFLYLTNSRAFHLFRFEIPNMNETVTMSCRGLNKVSKFTLWTVFSDIHDSLKYIFRCMTKFPEIKDVVLRDCLNGTVRLTIIQELFPNLQDLELTYCDVSCDIMYPWSHQVFTLFDNLSRSDFFQCYYSTFMHVSIPANLFVRKLTVTQSTLIPSMIHMNGSLHSVAIVQNNISRINAALFADVIDVQVIDLHDNGIIELESGCFKGKLQLKYLDLSSNAIQSLPCGIFDDLKSLIFLSLAKNKIEYLHCKLFYFLFNLITLNMENNQLATLDWSVFPAESFNLQHLIFNYNPFKAIPVALFYVKGLRNAEFKFTNISSITMFKEKVNVYLLVEALQSTTVHIEDYYESSTRLIDLTGSNVTEFKINFSPDEWLIEESNVLRYILKYFKFELKQNPLSCFSDVVPFKMVLDKAVKSGEFNGNEYFFKEWLCTFPLEFFGTPAFSIRPEDTYLNIDGDYCPDSCECYLRYNQSITIIDCRGRHLTTLPTIIVHGLVDLRLENNNISVLTSQSNLFNVRQLLLSNNTLIKIDPNVFDGMTNVTILKLDGNFLSYVPENLANLNLSTLYIHNNPLSCDCRSLWLKHWILNFIQNVENIKQITCQTVDGFANKFISVPDNKFVCREKISDNISTINTSHLVISSACVFTVILIIFLVYIYRYEIKVLIYVKLEWHPFDRRNHKEYENIDLTVIHTMDSEHLMTKYILQPLQKRGFTVSSSTKDFIAGYSIQKNISAAIYHSKHILLVLSGGILANSSILECIWSDCQDKIKSRSNFLIATSICDKSKLRNISKDFNKYLKLHQCLKFNNILFLEKIIYILSSYPSRFRTEPNLSEKALNFFHPVHDGRIRGEIYDVFVCFSENEQNLTKTRLIADLEKSHYKVIRPDQDFNPGETVLKNVITAVTSSLHTILITREPRNWNQSQIFAFKYAHEKTHLHNYNHLIVVHTDSYDHVETSVDREFNKYKQHNVCLHESDPYLLERLKLALRPKIVTEFSSL